MNRLMILAIILTMVTGLTVMAEEPSAPDAGWVDVTREVAANQADTGGWTKDDTGKVFRSEDSNQIKIIHSSFGTFRIDLPGRAVYKVVGGNDVVQEGAVLLQRDAGQTLVIKTNELKFKVQFNEKVTGMKGIPGIKGM